MATGGTDIRRSEGNLTVETVEGKAAMAAFVDAPTALYEGLPGFVPALFMEQDMSLNPKKSTFFENGRARYFLARRNGKIVGRISAQIVKEVPTGLPDSTGMFGCFDALDDAEAVNELFAAAEAWLKLEGCTHIFGPVTLHINGEPGLLVEGQTIPRMILTPWHPTYLGPLVEKAGYTLRKQLVNWRIDNTGGPQVEERGFARRVSTGALGPNARFRHLNKRQMHRDIEFICEIYNDAWAGNELFAPLRPIDLLDLEKSMKPLLPPESCTFVEIDGEPAGVLVILPNLFQAFKGLGARPNPVGWVKLVWRLWRRRFTEGRVILFGVAQRYNKSVKGMAIAIALIEEILKRRGEYEHVALEAGWVLDDNEPLNAILKRFEFKPARRFSLYLKAI